MLVEERAGVPMLVPVFATAATWLAVNLRGCAPLVRAGLVAILLGALANGLVIAANGRMPYSPHAAATVGLPTDLVTPKNAPADRDTRLTVLGDVVPVPPHVHLEADASRDVRDRFDRDAALHDRRAGD